jgi:ketosteroid isomerase-like protein
VTAELCLLAGTAGNGSASDPSSRDRRRPKENPVHRLLERRDAFVVAPEGTEQVKLTAPGAAQVFNHVDRGDQFAVDRVVWDTSADDFDALVLPGGVANRRPCFYPAATPTTCRPSAWVYCMNWKRYQRLPE